MFKSVFGKYLTAFFAIILACFCVLLLIISGIIFNYAAEAKMESAKQVSYAVSSYLSSHLEGNTLSDVDQDAIAPALDLAATGADRLSVLLMDEQGNLVVSGGSPLVDVDREISLPSHVIERLKTGEDISALPVFKDWLGSIELVFAKPMIGADGSFLGSVVVCSPSARWQGLMELVTQTVLMASLLVLLASFIAVYYISARVSAPLKDMSRAAKDFAAGKFDRRVTVRGNDEVAELAMAFNQMAQSLENLDKTRSSFMANVSHDLRTPMTTIAGFIDAIRDGIIPPEKQEYYLGVVSTEVHRLSRLVSSLLDLTRIQAGERKFVIKPFDICEMGRQILISFEQPIEQRQLQIEFVCDEDTMLALADYDAIYQIFYNICDNAVKFSRDGGVLRVSIRHREDLKNKLQVSVYNEGEGIAQEDVPFVFERFYKGDKSRGLDKRGVGLGLYIAKTIIAAHGEDIWATSVEGRYCQFNFTLAESVSSTHSHTKDA